MEVLKPKISRSVSLAIILPAFNEASVIVDVLDSIPKNLTIKNVSVTISVIVIDDGSTDNTANIVSNKKGVTLIKHLLNSGAGAATHTGLTYAKLLNYDFVVTADSDGQHTTEDIIKIIEAIVNDEADLVIGSRLISTTGMPRHRIIGNKGLSLITFIIFGVFVTDSQSGLKALNKIALNKIEFQSNNYAFCSEMIWKAKQQKLKIKEIPIQAVYTEYSLSKGQSNWGALEIIKQIIKRRLLEFING